MPDEIEDVMPLPARSRNAQERARPSQAVVQAVHGSLRATEAYVRVLVDRIELARIGGQVSLDDVPADVLVRLTAVSDALQDGVDCVLRHLGGEFAQRMRSVADLEHQAVCRETPR